MHLETDGRCIRESAPYFLSDRILASRLHKLARVPRCLAMSAILSFVIASYQDMSGHFLSGSALSPLAPGVL